MIMVVRESIEKDWEKHLNTTESAECTENNCGTLRSLCTLWLITYAIIPFSRRNKKISKTLTLLINKSSATNLRLSAFICGLIKSLKTGQPYYIFNILLSNEFQEIIEI